MPPERLRGSPPEPAIPLARWADRQLAALARLARAPAIARLSGTGLLGERAALRGFTVPSRRSAGGGCQLFATQDGWLALNLSRPDDRSLLPALLLAEGLNPGSEANIARHVARRTSCWLLDRGTEMGLALAAHDEEPASPAIMLLAEGPVGPPVRGRPPLVLDLTGLWAGPLAGHLLWLAGARVIKIESRRRPDTMRIGDPALFATLNQGKANVSLNLADKAGQAALLRLLARADIVLEAARPRALLQMGIDAQALIAARRGMAWITITGHGTCGAAADRTGFGDDCGVAGGLTAALLARTGTIGFVGDAIADPLTGIRAALEAWKVWTSGRSARVGLSMSGIVAKAMHAEILNDANALNRDLIGWSGAVGQPFPAVVPRPVIAGVRAMGADNSQWLGQIAPC